VNDCQSLQANEQLPGKAEKGFLQRKRSLTMALVDEHVSAT
jgi:hypothetical protein